MDSRDLNEKHWMRVYAFVLSELALLILLFYLFKLTFS